MVGTNWNDLTSNNIDGTLTGGPTLSRITAVFLSLMVQMIRTLDHLTVLSTVDLRLKLGFIPPPLVQELLVIWFADTAHGLFIDQGQGFEDYQQVISRITLTVLSNRQVPVLI